mmetsp:Transcript_139072/g.444142  ORF Transcript_139072/g.444142 Transcript_139072/m.444142 type:complete len:281 (-) Transcript_139072:2-844(-)
MAPSRVVRPACRGLGHRTLASGRHPLEVAELEPQGLQHVVAARAARARRPARRRGAAAGGQLWHEIPGKDCVSQGQLLLPLCGRAVPAADVQLVAEVILPLLTGVRPAPTNQIGLGALVRLLQVLSHGILALRGRGGRTPMPDALDKLEELPVDAVHGVLPGALGGAVLDVVSAACVVHVLGPTARQWRVEGLPHRPSEVLLLLQVQVHAKAQAVLVQVAGHLHHGRLHVPSAPAAGRRNHGDVDAIAWDGAAIRGVAGARYAGHAAEMRGGEDSGTTRA